LSSGEIHVIIGSMFAGKTTALLRGIQTASNNERNVAVIKSNKDTRYGLDSAVTHDGVKLPCFTLVDLSSLAEKIRIQAYENFELDEIWIDEAQFFEDLYDLCCKAAADDGKTVILAGLDGDYMRHSLGIKMQIQDSGCSTAGRKPELSLKFLVGPGLDQFSGSDLVPQV
ncbi:thymidine kinase-like, partial [Telopea speciosissima]|uniref:thymidine kinase-like n=1 Tax=Telopea speciosissima TaxID=54955 RepID=UPI001CC5EB42